VGDSWRNENAKKKSPGMNILFNIINVDFSFGSIPVS